MDIEDRADKWLAGYEGGDSAGTYTSDDMLAAYLAGSRQTQADYAAHYNR